MKQYFSTIELPQIITSNFYSALYDNSENYNFSPSKNILKQTIISSSAIALKMCIKFPDPMISFKDYTKCITGQSLKIYFNANMQCSLLCISTCFWVLPAPESWSKHFFLLSSTFFVNFKPFLVISSNQNQKPFEKTCRFGCQSCFYT